MKTALYLRVSTEKQTVDNQRPDLVSFAQSQGWRITGEFSDEWTGTSGNRPGFRAMLQAAAQRRFDVLLVWSVDRISREGAAKVFGYLSQLTSYGVKFHSFQEPHLSTLGPFGDVVLAMCATFAKLERDKLSERTKAALAIRIANGVRLGRPRVRVNVAEICTLRASGLSWIGIARKTGVARSTAQRVATQAAVSSPKIKLSGGINRSGPVEETGAPSPART